MLNKIAEFILEKRLKEMEGRISQLERIIDLGGMTITDIAIANTIQDCNGKIPCTLYGFIEKDKVKSLTQSISDKISHPRSRNLLSFESTISFETLNGVKIIEQKIGSNSEPDWAVKETLKVIIPLAKDSGMTKQDFVDLIDKH